MAFMRAALIAISRVAYSALCDFAWGRFRPRSPYGHAFPERRKVAAANSDLGASFCSRVVVVGALALLESDQYSSTRIVREPPPQKLWQSLRVTVAKESPAAEAPAQFESHN